MLLLRKLGAEGEASVAHAASELRVEHGAHGVR